VFATNVRWYYQCNRAWNLKVIKMFFDDIYYDSKVNKKKWRAGQTKTKKLFTLKRNFLNQKRKNTLFIVSSYSCITFRLLIMITWLLLLHYWTNKNKKMKLISVAKLNTFTDFSTGISWTQTVWTQSLLRSWERII